MQTMQIKIPHKKSSDPKNKQWGIMAFVRRNHQREN